MSDKFDIQKNIYLSYFDISKCKCDVVSTTVQNNWRYEEGYRVQIWRNY